MVLALALAAMVSNPTPAPASLQPLKVIASVRATPLCSALRNNIAPAIASLLDNDAVMDRSVLVFGTTYQHALLSPTTFPPNSWGFIDRGHLTYLIGPMVANLKKIDNLLADHKVFVDNPKTADDRRLAQIKERLGEIEAQQKDALNVVSGYDATALLYDVLNAGVEPAWRSALEIRSSTSSASLVNSSAFFGTQGSAGSQNQRFLRPLTSPGRFDTSLAYNPFHIFSDAIVTARNKGTVAEAAAASVIAPIADYCRTK